MRKKTVSYGINHTMEPQMQKSFLNYYKDYIESVYMYIPNYKLACELSYMQPPLRTTFSANYYEDIIDFCKTLGFKINFTFNAYSEERMRLLPEAFPYLEKYEPSEICCFDGALSQLQSVYSKGKYYRSILSGFRSKTDLATLTYDGYMLRTTYPWEYGLLNNKDNRLMVDFICYQVCHPKFCKTHGEHDKDCGMPYHNKIFAAEMNICKDFEIFLARHMYLGRDLELLDKAFPNNIITYKYASRMHCCRRNPGTTYRTLNGFSKAFDTYINNEKSIDFNFSMIEFLSFNCQIDDWLRQCYNWASFDQNKFYQEKTRIWQQLLPDLEEY